MSPFSRRGFLAASAATAASLMLPAQVRAQSGRMSLTAATRTIDVRGKAATVWGLLDGAGRSGLVLDPGQAFAVDLTNGLAEPTIIHWHGQIPDNAQAASPTCLCRSSNQAKPGPTISRRDRAKLDELIRLAGIDNFYLRKILLDVFPDLEGHLQNHVFLIQFRALGTRVLSPMTGIDNHRPAFKFVTQRVRRRN